MKGIKRIGLIGGSMSHVVNQTRLAGFKKGMESQNIENIDDYIYVDLETKDWIKKAVDELVEKKAECIVCMDDGICIAVLEALREKKLRVPDQMKVASFYNSQILDNHQPAITALQYDPKELGIVACETLFDYLDGKTIPKKELLGYEVLLKGSTM
jgi:DNA-binding LacI/PurR family transcriptional regulator